MSDGGAETDGAAAPPAPRGKAKAARRLENRSVRDKGAETDGSTDVELVQCGVADDGDAPTEKTLSSLLGDPHVADSGLDGVRVADSLLERAKAHHPGGERASRSRRQAFWALVGRLFPVLQKIVNVLVRRLLRRSCRGWSNVMVRATSTAEVVRTSGRRSRRNENGNDRVPPAAVAPPLVSQFFGKPIRRQ